MDEETRSPRDLWDAKALEWDAHVGDDGDANRRFQSDPVLWRMIGDASGKRVLDAGCGTGYLMVKLARAGALVTGVDFSEAMVAVAGARAAETGLPLDIRVDDCSTLATVESRSMDLLVSNYVLMDLPDLDGAAESFFRVLKPGGHAVVALLHPCFDAPAGPERPEEGVTLYRWPWSYFDEREMRQDWGRFTSPFVAYHRPLSRYWRAFVGAGFTIEDFDEPVVPDPPPPDIDAERAARYRMSPYSVVFRLRKA